MSESTKLHTSIDPSVVHLKRCAKRSTFPMHGKKHGALQNDA